MRQQGVTGFVTVAGDRHSFWAGLAAKSLPPKPFDPVGVAFVTGSISAPGTMEALESRFPKDAPLRPLFVGQPLNLLLRHGVRACLEYAKHGDVARARQASNPNVAAPLSFVDMGGHGYAIVTAAAQALDVDFVCVPRPIDRAAQPDGGPVRYRVRHRARLWRKGETPKLQQHIIEGDPAFSI